MKTLEELKLEKRRLLARESLRQHSKERNEERLKLKSEVRALKNKGLRETVGKIRGKVGVARERVQQLQSKIAERQPKRKSQGFQGFNMKLITG